MTEEGTAEMAPDSGPGRWRSRAARATCSPGHSSPPGSRSWTC